MLKTALLLFATSYFAWYLERHETAMIYPFDATYTAPGAAGEPRMVETRFNTGDGESLVLWRVAAEPGRPTLLYLPGNAGALGDRAERFARLIDRGYGVTALAYRGSSGSTGTPDEAHLTMDARAVAMAEPGRPLILYGESLGTAVAIKLAAAGVGNAVVLEAPFTSIPHLIASQYPGEALEHLITQRWDSLAHVADLHTPLLVVHGTRDRLVPFEMGRAIFETAPSPEKVFLRVDGMGHSGLWTSDVQTAIFDFLDDR